MLTICEKSRINNKKQRRSQMKTILCTTLLIVGLVITDGSGSSEKVLTADDQYATYTEKLVVYYQSVGKKVNPKIIEKTLRVIDYYLPKYFPNGEFTRHDYIALAMLESNFNQYEVGSSGEVGIFQIMRMHVPSTIENPFHVSVNTRLSMKVLRWTYQRHKDYKKAIIAYNGIVKSKTGDWNERYWKAFQIRKKLLTELGIV
jgi:soluble lytic murein transglycosylase-like protein